MKAPARCGGHNSTYKKEQIKMIKLGLQLFTVRDFMTTEEDIRECFGKIKAAGYDQIQTAGCAIPYKRFGELAKEYGLEIVGTHDDFDMMLNDFDKALENHKLLGTTNMGTGGYWCGTTSEVMSEYIEKANIIAKNAAKHGMKFTYHNHSHEFIKLDNGKTAMDMLVEGLDKENATFCLDTFWVQHAGGDPREWIEKLAGRIDILHLKDMKRVQADSNVQQITEIGNGNMNWKGILESAKKAGVKYYIVEQDTNWVPNCFASIRKSAEYLRSIMD